MGGFETDGGRGPERLTSIICLLHGDEGGRAALGINRRYAARAYFQNATGLVREPPGASSGTNQNCSNAWAFHFRLRQNQG